MRHLCRLAPGEAGLTEASPEPAVPGQEETPGPASRTPQKEPCSLVVSSIRPTANEQSLRLLFESAGHVLGCKLPKDKTTGAHKGFGFVMMASVGEAEMAAQKFNNFEVRPSRPREHMMLFQPEIWQALSPQSPHPYSLG